MFTNANRDLEVKLSTVDRFSKTINSHELCLEIGYNKGTTEEVFIEPSKLNIMVAYGISKVIGT